MAILQDFQYLRIQNKQNYKTYSRTIDRAGRTKYKEEEIPNDMELVPIIRNLSKNRTLQVHDMLNIRSEPLSIQIQTLYFDKYIIKLIEEGTVLAASDRLVKAQYIRAYWYITNQEKTIKMENRLYSN